MSQQRAIQYSIVKSVDKHTLLQMCYRMLECVRWVRVSEDGKCRSGLEESKASLARSLRQKSMVASGKCVCRQKKEEEATPSDKYIHTYNALLYVQCEGGWMNRCGLTARRFSRKWPHSFRPTAPSVHSLDASLCCYGR